MLYITILVKCMRVNELQCGSLMQLKADKNQAAYLFVNK